MSKKGGEPSKRLPDAGRSYDREHHVSVRYDGDIAMDKKDGLVGDLYESALRQDGFFEVVQHMAEWIGADIFHMYSVDAVRDVPHFSHYSSAATTFEAMIGHYVQYYRALDPRVDLVNSQPAQTWFACQDHFDDPYVSRSEFFQDFLIPNGLRYMFGTRIATSGRDDVLVAFVRAAGRTPFEARERAKLASVSGHLQRAIRLWQDALVLHHDAATGAELAGQLNVAVFALDKNFRTVSANREAETMLRATGCLKLQHGRLAATSSKQNDRLQGALARVLKTRIGETVVLCEETTGHFEIFLGISVLPRDALGRQCAGASLLVMARRRGCTPLATADQLRQAFNLSTAEAKVAEALIEGRSPDQYAERNSISISTVRTQLRAIFEKTRTRSQAEAVGLMVWVLTQRVSHLTGKTSECERQG
ncbi:helix-turn-helix transcriptional regulator [Paraburkholderia nodosa]|uniref:helix-turn-helix transcriptional regulator n=1 Tax=Paraburkholderia nodosa TaxID=392320 RepID=UPI00210AF347|nr:helix-turn-helix transcriptional regulator [Paraburkholderia nodosa]